MPTRRRIAGYGPSEVPHPQSGGHLLPPPDGNPPIRLPIGMPQQEQVPPQAAPPQGGDPFAQDPHAEIVRLLQSLGKL